MPVTCTEEGRTLTVRLEGEVDHHAARRLMEDLGRRVDAALPRYMVLDLGGVSFMDSSGIAVVLRTWRRMEQIGGAMTLRNVPAQSAKVLRAAGIDKLIPFADE